MLLISLLVTFQLCLHLLQTGIEASYQSLNSMSAYFGQTWDYDMMYIHGSAIFTYIVRSYDTVFAYLLHRSFHCESILHQLYFTGNLLNPMVSNTLTSKYEVMQCK